jgi:predicted DNA binding CopG/RHH family protein
MRYCVFNNSWWNTSVGHFSSSAIKFRLEFLLPESLIAALKTLANKKDVPYQSLVKMFLAEKVKEEMSAHLRTDTSE